MDGMIYRGFHIASAARQHSDLGAWTAETIIVERRARSTVEHIFPTSHRFGTKQAADRASLDFGKRVLEGKIPGVTL